MRRAALKHLALVVRRDKQHLAELVLEGGGEVDPVVSRLLTGLLELSTGKVKSVVGCHWWCVYWCGRCDVYCWWFWCRCVRVVVAVAFRNI